MQDTIKIHSEGYARRVRDYPYAFDLEKWRVSRSYELIKCYCGKDDAIIEVGCLTGHHLVLLEQEGYTNLTGIDFLQEAIDWGKEHSKGTIRFICEDFISRDNVWGSYDKIICFDVLEHQMNIGLFLQGVQFIMKPNAEALFLVPIGKEYDDIGHIAFWPDADRFKRTLERVFSKVEVWFEKDENKLFARCEK